jgi:acylphosphatase
MTLCIRCIVTGRVQGVFFRAATQRKALELDINGWARNLPNGCVEVVACGDENKVRKLQDWLWVGPQHASVSDVSVTGVEDPLVDGFSVR